MVDLRSENWQLSLSSSDGSSVYVARMNGGFKAGAMRFFVGPGCWVTGWQGIGPVRDVKIGIKTNGKICRGGR